MGNTTAANALGEEGDAGAEAIAIVSLSFTAAARGGMGTQWFGGSTTSGAGAIPPPPDAAYLCNMAVAQAHRGRGVAKAGAYTRPLFSTT